MRCVFFFSFFFSLFLSDGLTRYIVTYNQHYRTEARRGEERRGVGFGGGKAGWID